MDPSLLAQMVKTLPAMQETWVQSLGWEDPPEKGMVIHFRTLPGGFHGQRSLAGYSPWGCKELDMTEQLILSLSPEKHRCTQKFAHTFAHTLGGGAWFTDFLNRVHRPYAKKSA